MAAQTVEVKQQCAERDHLTHAFCTKVTTEMLDAHRDMCRKCGEPDAKNHQTGIST